MARSWLVTFACLVTACSGESDPPPLQPRLGGTGGGAAEGGEGPSSGGSTSGSGGTGNTGGLARPDPDEVYILGSLELGRPDLLALCHWSSPDDYAVGFNADMEVYKAKVGEVGLLYQLRSNAFEIRRFAPDLLSSDPLEAIAYPEDPSQDDPVFAELECPPGSVVLDFVVGPADRIVYLCTGYGWFDDGEPVYAGAGDMRALGYDNLALFTESGVGHFVVNFATDERTRIMDIGTIRAAHAIPDGFLVAGIGADGDGLWEVGSDGVASSRGLYEERPPGDMQYYWELDAEGTLYELEGVGINETTLMRRRVGGSNEIVYSDFEAGNVFINKLAIVTGP